VARFIYEATTNIHRHIHISVHGRQIAALDALTYKINTICPYLLKLKHTWYKLLSVK